MGYQAKILLDSCNPCGNRLTTFCLTYPRMVHCELMTHRMFSRNSSSSRAIPVERMIQQVLDEPVEPVFWGRNQAGMQAQAALTGDDLARARAEWFRARDNAVASARALHAAGAHKQITNRVLEAWMWITVICSATEYGNWFTLRCDTDAQPEIRHLADMMWAAYAASEPRPLAAGEWHLPLCAFPGDELLSDADRRKVAVGRCARVSYLTHDGRRDVAADLVLHDRLLGGSKGIGHFSPFEHVAQALAEPARSGNFIGWAQYRKEFPGEHHEKYERGR